MGTNIRGSRIKLVCPGYEWCFCRLGPWNFKFLKSSASRALLFHFYVVKSESIAVTSGSIHGPPYEKQHIASIEAVQHSTLRFVTGGYSRYSSVTQMRETLGWETLECRRHAATTFYKSINNLIYLPIPSSVRPADPRHVATNTNAYKYSFFPRTIPLWNNLPSYYSRHCYQSWSLPSICPAYH